MNSNELLSACLGSPILRPYFSGVFPADLLPRTVPIRPACVIINSDPSHLSGTHWTCFYLSAFSAGVEYFDSLGAAPTNPFFSRFIARNGGLVWYNRKPIQATSSDVCGEYSCTYSIKRCLGLSSSQFVNIFNKSRNKNDHLLLIMFNSLFTCNAHFNRPTLRSFHVQSCAPTCHTRPVGRCSSRAFAGYPPEQALTPHPRRRKGRGSGQARLRATRS